MTFTSIYIKDNSKVNNKNKQINKTGIHISNLIVNNMNKNNKNMKKINLDLDKDEIINLPNSPQYHNRNSKKYCCSTTLYNRHNLLL